MSELSVEKILEEYRVEVTEALALAYSVADFFPIEILNEVRSAFTHLARASEMGADTDEGKTELDSSKRHLLRCRLDCAKLCLLTEAEKLDGDMEALVHATACPKSILETAEQLKKNRKDLAAKEANSPPGKKLVVSYFGLFELYQDFRKNLRIEYGEILVCSFEKQFQDRIDKAESEGFRKGRRQTMWAALAIGLVASVLGTLLLKAFGI